MVNRSEVLAIINGNTPPRQTPPLARTGSGNEILSGPPLEEINVSVADRPPEETLVYSSSQASHYQGSSSQTRPASAQPGPSQKFKNFRRSEDLCLALAYKQISTDAYQDGETFWDKIAVAFSSTIGNEFVQERNGKSLKNRWNTQIQPNVLKFVGFLMKSLKTYHSGWAMVDYMMDAKMQYMLDSNTEFKFELVWKAVNTLPKFAVPVDGMSPKVKAALDMDEGGLGKEDPRPEVGKKKAKSNKIEADKKKKEGAQVDVKSGALVRLAQAAEQKKKVLESQANLHLQILQDQQRLQEDQQRLQFFNNIGDSAAKDEFFALKAKEYILDLTKILESQGNLHLQVLQDQQRLQEDQQRLQFFNSIGDSAAKDEFFALKAKEYILDLKLDIAAKEKLANDGRKGEKRKVSEMEGEGVDIHVDQDIQQEKSLKEGMRQTSEEDSDPTLEVSGW